MVQINGQGELENIFKISKRLLQYITTYVTLSHLYDDVFTNQRQLKMEQSSVGLCKLENEI